MLRALASLPGYRENPSEADIIFAGFETAAEFCWPGVSDPDDAVIGGTFDSLWSQICNRAGKSVVRLAHKHREKTVVVFEGPPVLALHELAAGLPNCRVASLSAYLYSHRHDYDISLPPKALSKGVASTQIKRTKRPILFSFQGSASHPVRSLIVGLDNGSDQIIRLVEKSDYMRRSHDLTSSQISYDELLVQSEFALVPRGDELFSYRFTEALAMGCIPVVLADGWVLPFSELYDPQQYSVVVGESQWRSIPKQLRGISGKRRMRLRGNGRNYYDDYCASFIAMASSLLRSIDMSRRQPSNPSLEGWRRY